VTSLPSPRRGSSPALPREATPPSAQASAEEPSINATQVSPYAPTSECPEMERNAAPSSFDAGRLQELIEPHSKRASSSPKPRRGSSPSMGRLRTAELDLPPPQPATRPASLNPVAP